MRLPNTTHIIAVAILSSFLASAARGQNPLAPAHDPTAQDSTTTDAQSSAPRMTPEQLALIDRYLTNVRAQPVGKIDTRTAAAGQGITLQTTQDATLANGTELTKGTRLTGHILRVQEYQQGGAAAVLSMQIDRAILRDGSALPIRCVLRTVATSAAPTSAGQFDASQGASRPRRGGGGGGSTSPMGGAIPMGSPASMGGPMSGDSSAGSMGNSPIGNPGSSSYPGAPNNPNSTTTRPSTTGGTVPTGDAGIGGTGGRTPLPNTSAAPAAEPEQPVASAGETVHDAPQRTGLPGVMLSGISTVGISGTLSAYDHNIALDSSTQLTLGVITTK